MLFNILFIFKFTKFKYLNFKIFNILPSKKCLLYLLFGPESNQGLTHLILLLGFVEP